jgi:ABC-type nickel/cobalt efflux system permease component RcnA
MASISLLLLGLLLGLRHALEADHLAAVASLATRSRSPRSTVLQGVAWGLGHTLTLLAVGALCLLLRVSIPERLAGALEGAVGVMLLLLGADVLWRLRRGRVHIHPHRHTDGTLHLHVHSHAPEEAHDPHLHEHAHGLSRRALLVGLVHGLAGSAALLLVTVSTISSFWLGVAYIAVFGIGSICGMAALSAIISLPLLGSSRFAGWSKALETVVGVSTILIGVWVLYKAY